MVLLKFYLNRLGKQPRCQRFKRFSTSILPHKLVHEGVPPRPYSFIFKKKPFVQTNIKGGNNFYGVVASIRVISLKAWLYKKTRGSFTEAL